MNAPDGGREPPTPEQLAAYADGEFAHPRHAELCARVERWLSDHPAARAEVESQRRLTGLWAQTRPAEPAEPVWGQMLPALEAQLLAGTRPPDGLRWRPLAWVAGVIVAGTAAALVVFALLRSPDDPGLANVNPAPQVAPPQQPEPFAVATADEVEILSVSGPDTGTLVVGRVPLEGPMELVTRAEFEVQRIDPEYRMGEGGTPMIWVREQNGEEE